MNFAFYAPFKPMGHPNPSGDLAIGTELLHFLTDAGHRALIASRLRTRWITHQPWRWPVAAAELLRCAAWLRRSAPDLWLTYHSYYKAPDILGPLCARAAGIPYAIFQGIYSTKRRKRPGTLPGFLLNRFALCRAQMVFTNKHVDLENLRRLLPPERLTYVRPGLHPEQFAHDPAARARLRARWGAGDDPVILSAAMFRPGCKTESLEWVIRTAAGLMPGNPPFHLWIAGDGENRDHLKALAGRLLPGRVRFVGRVPRPEMAAFYNAGDIFFFPGIDEALGMVYLEAMSCGLPVVAFNGWGVPETVLHERTGLLSAPRDARQMTRNLQRLLTRPALRREMGAAAAKHVRDRHDLDRNYAIVETVLQNIVAKWQGRKA